ncbi:MAG: MBOAT family O-acyltransferase [Candidatus Binatia bacterium]|nr:MBOAT family O-acyltransferase [Candidatus Binatia bacterium]
MVFTEFRFAAFFLAIFAVHWLLPGNRSRKLWLLAASYSFYAAWNWRFLSLIVASTLIDYSVGRGLERSTELSRRRGLLAVSLVGNLGILGFFKYYNFFATSAAEFTSWLGLGLPLQALEVVLPLGISFYTFQTLSYTVDVYRGRLQPTRSLADFALFVSFFPQLVAGPIVRAIDFLPQLAKTRRLADVGFRTPLMRFLLGYVKKACIADQIAAAIDPVFANPAAYDTVSLWLSSLLYSLQIYCDFSGYSDMAIATAAMVGYHLPENFGFPYLAKTIQEFWRRWHITLTTWFRDYLYIPLGGNRTGSVRLAINLCTVFLLCGLWHGAAWTFVVWGIYHGVFLTLERLVPLKRLPPLLGHVYVLLVVSCGFVIFRSADLPAAGVFLSGLIPGGDAGRFAVWSGWWVVLLSFGLVHAALSRWPLETPVARLPAGVFALGYGVLVAVLLPWAANEYEPFIYFQF